MTTLAQSAAPPSNEQANHEYLWGEIARLRLLLRRRMLWLRRHWKSAGPQSLVVGDGQADRLIAGEDRQAEAEFYRTQPEVRAIDAQRTESERRIDLSAARFREAGAPPPLDQLVSMFELSRFEREVLVLCLAPELDASFERLYGYLQDDATKRYATPQLAVDLFTAGSTESRSAWLSFQSSGRLRHFRLVSMSENGGASAPLRLPPRIASFLAGVNHLDERVERLLEPIPSLPVPSRHAAHLDALAQYVSDRLAKGTWPRLNLIGPQDSGKSGLARALCDRLRLGLYRLDWEKGGAFDSEIWNLLERDSVLGQFALYLRCGDLPWENLRAIEAIAGRLRVLLLFGSEAPLQTEWPILPVTVERLRAEDRSELWRDALGSIANDVDGDVDSIAETFDFGPSGVARAIWQARSAAVLRDPVGGVVTRQDIWLACRSRANHGMTALAQAITPCQTWADIVVPPGVERQLRAITGQVRNRYRVYTDWGFGSRLSRGRGISALFAGPSGTGKTMAAEILAGDLGLPLYRIDLSAVVNKYIGETEKNLRRVFDAAERSGSILFFDEADALFGKRTEVKDSHDRYANIEIDYLLQRMEEYSGLAILATNMKASLDQAFLRRLRFVVDFPFPDAEHRCLIWQKHFPAEAPVGEIRYDLLSKLGIAGGNIRNIVINGAFLAAAEGSAIGMNHLMRAAADEYAKEEKLVTPAEFGDYCPLVRRP